MKVKTIKYEIVSNGSNVGRTVIHLKLDKRAKDMELGLILEGLEKTSQEHSACKMLFIEGYEPLLDQKGLLLLLDKLYHSWHIIIRTCGAIMPDHFLRQRMNVWEVSPQRTSNLDKKELLKISTDSVLFFKNSPISSFEWVVLHEDELSEIEDLCSVNSIDSSKVIITPQFPDKKLNNKIRDFCLKNGCRYGANLTFLGDQNSNKNGNS